MNRNKKIRLCFWSVVLVFLLILSKQLLSIDVLNYKIKYEDINFSIKEKYYDEKYHLEIEGNNKKYLFKIYDNLKRKKRIISNLYYYKDKTYECLLPIINNQVVVDMVCYKNNIAYDYNSIRGNNSTLDSYVINIKEYEENKFIDNKSKTKNINTVKYYINNKIDKEIAITTYKGLIISNTSIDLFKRDVYNNKISAFVDKYYLIADYDNEYEFRYFYLVNLLDKSVDRIKSKNEISLDSYIQGIVDNKIYLYDKDNQNQYEIDVKNKTIKLISTNQYVKYYKNNKWEKLNKLKANKEIYFDYIPLSNYFTDYDKVIESEDYYYLIKNNNNNYNLYRVDRDDISIYKYIGSVHTNIIYVKDNYIYYKYGDKIYYYSDNTGHKTILEDSELKYNATIKYYIY